MKKAIVTGATGFLGSWLVKELISHDIQTIAVIRSDESDVSILQNEDKIRVVICPFAEYHKLPILILDRDIDVFFHLAWAGTSAMHRSDIKLQLNNLQAACNAVKAASEIGCSKFVNAGSIMEYEAMQYIPEDTIESGLNNIYSIAKSSAYFMAKSLAVSLNLPYINAVISNIYGAGEKSARFINSTLRKFIKHEKTLFTHGNQMYDFLYVTDAVRAFYLIGEKGKPYTNYYIGNSKPYPLRQFVIMMKDIVDKNIIVTFGEIPIQGASLTYQEFDSTKLEMELGFKAYVTFEEGIKKTVQWIRKNE